MNLRIDETEIRKAIAVLKPNDKLFEIRYISSSGKLNFSGYFKNADTLIESLKHLAPTEEGNIYITLNEIDEACYSRQQRDCFVKNCKTTTSDNDIKGYNWLMLDFDPERPSGTSSSNEELEIARKRAGRVYKYLDSRGWNAPIVAMSGNGYHLLYKISFAKNSERTELVKKTLETLNLLFGDDKLKVDVKVFNPSRICKLYGTMAVKGANTTERPHRMAKIVKMPDGMIQSNKKCLLEELTEIMPKAPDKPQKYNNYSPNSFELREWIIKHNIAVTQESSFNGGTKFILEQCPFDSNHKGKDACLFQLSNGAVSFHCFHASCADKKWQNFRRLYEPNAYENKQEYHKPNRELPPPIQIDEPVFLSPTDILNRKTPPSEYIKTGIYKLDEKLRGLNKGFVTLLSGLRASGKSSIISQLALEAAKQNYSTAIYSGELTADKLLQWLALQAAGKNNVIPTEYEGYYTPTSQAKKAIAKWLDGKVWVYNNNYSNEFAFIKDELQKCVDEKKIDLIILDNLMTLDISSLDNLNFFQRQSKFVAQLENFAKSNNVHILFVAHPRKSQGFLRLEDVAGSNDIVNRVDNAVILHRVNRDFKERAEPFISDKALFTVLEKATNVIEICKDRDGGTQDYFIPLYFEQETKRLKNREGEFKYYGWDNQAEQVNSNTYVSSVGHLVQSSGGEREFTSADDLPF